MSLRKDGLHLTVVDALHIADTNETTVKQVNQDEDSNQDVSIATKMRITTKDNNWHKEDYSETGKRDSHATG